MDDNRGVKHRLLFAKRRLDDLRKLDLDVGLSPISGI